MSPLATALSTVAARAVVLPSKWSNLFINNTEMCVENRELSINKANYNDLFPVGRESASPAGKNCTSLNTKAPLVTVFQINEIPVPVPIPSI